MQALDAATVLAEASGWSLSNLELNKLLYLSQMNYMGDHFGNPLFQDDFQAWKLGPVIPSIYNRVKDYGSAPVRNLFYRPAFIDASERKAVLDVYDRLKGVSAWDLVAITHWVGGAWNKYFIPGRMSQIIPKGAILDEYRDRLAA